MFFKKEEKVPVVDERTVDGAKVWVVSWNSLSGKWPDSPTLVNVKRVAKAFVDKDDATSFKEALEKAMKLLQCSFVIDIKMEEQE